MDATAGDPPTRLAAVARDRSLPGALRLFDDLAPVRVEEMTGAWRGSGLETGHPFDGMLEDLGWWGKRFDGEDGAHPLVFEDRWGRFSMNPAGVPMAYLVRRAGLLRHPAVTGVARSLLRLRRTRLPRARLRMTEYRGVSTGTMSYDALPINDHFRRVDDDTLLGLMDLRGGGDPFAFVLRRAAPRRPRP